MAVRSGEKYAAILDAAQRVIARHGYHRAQISKIAAEAGVAAGTVYLYFQNKPDLLVCLFRERLGTLIDEARSSFTEAMDPSEKLRQFITHHLRALARRQDLAVVTQIEMRQADLGVQQQISQIMKGYFQIIDDLIQQGIERGAFRQADPRQIRNLIFGTLDQTVTAWVMSGFRFDLEGLAEPTYALIAGGVCTEREGGTQGHGHSGAA